MHPSLFGLPAPPSGKLRAGPLLALGLLAGFLAGCAAWFAVMFGFGLYFQSFFAQYRKEDESRALAARAPENGTVTSTTTGQLDLAFGESQVAQMVRERPGMERVKASDPIWRYCAKAFGGGVTGGRIYWDPVEPADGYDFDFDAPIDGQTACIRFRKLDDLSPDYETTHLWFRAVSAFEALRDEAQLQKMRDRGYRGELSRREWIDGYATLTYAQLRRINRVFWTSWKPTARTHGFFIIKGNIWATHLLPTYALWRSRYPDPQAWDGFAAEYDGQMARAYSLRMQVQRLKPARSKPSLTTVGISSVRQSPR